MGRSIYTFGAVVTALMLLALACDGGGDGSPSPAAQATGTAAAMPTEEATSPPGDTVTPRRRSFRPR